MNVVLVMIIHIMIVFRIVKAHGVEMLQKMNVEFVIVIHLMTVLRIVLEYGVGMQKLRFSILILIMMDKVLVMVMHYVMALI